MAIIFAPVMTDAASQPVKTPKHLWVVGIVAVLWNAIGVMDFTLTELKNEAYLKAFTPEQLAVLAGFPLWAVITWGAGVYGGFIGSILLLVRKRSAVPVFLISLIGAVLTSLYSHVLSDTMKQMGGGTGAVIFSLVITVIAVLLWVYARAMAKRGVLR
jgi:hypothetical protein